MQAEIDKLKQQLQQQQAPSSNDTELHPFSAGVVTQLKEDEVQWCVGEGFATQKQRLRRLIQGDNGKLDCQKFDEVKVSP